MACVLGEGSRLAQAWAGGGREHQGLCVVLVVVCDDDMTVIGCCDGVWSVGSVDVSSVDNGCALWEGDRLWAAALAGLWPSVYNNNLLFSFGSNGTCYSLLSMSCISSLGSVVRSTSHTRGLAVCCQSGLNIFPIFPEKHLWLLK